MTGRAAGAFPETARCDGRLVRPCFRSLVDKPPAKPTGEFLKSIEIGTRDDGGACRRAGAASGDVFEVALVHGHAEGGSRCYER